MLFSSTHRKQALTRLLTFFSLIILHTLPAHASHIMGADLTYTCLGGNTYEFTLTVYRDCSEFDVKPEAQLFFSSPSCGIPEFSRMATWVSEEEISQVCAGSLAQTTCNGGSLLGVEQHMYKLTHTFSQQCSDWNINWRLCCRNFSITNSQFNNASKLYIETTLDNLNSTCNSSPYFTTAPVPFVCDGEPFNYNNGAVDPDGDSLAFELIAPLDHINGSTPVAIPYIAGLSPNNPIATATPNGFSFDELSGQFSFTPSGQQQGIVALLVKEYRNGIQIGSTMRDIQVVVTDCINKSPVLNLTNNNPTDQGASILTDNTFSVCTGSTLDFELSASDPNTADQLLISSNVGEAIPGADLQIVGTNPTLVRFRWTPSIADIGNHFFTLSIDDGGCPINGKQILGFNIIVQEGAVLPPQDLLICPEQSTSLQLQASTPNINGTGSYAWLPTTGLSDPTVRSPLASISDPTTYTVTYERPGQCPIIEQVNVVPEAELILATDSVRLCEGESALLEARFVFKANPVPFVYTWDPPIALSNPSISSPLATPSTSTQYLVSVSTLNCFYSREVFVQVDENIALPSLPDLSICQGLSTPLVPSGTSLPTGDYTWTPTLSLDDNTSANPLANPTLDTQYTLSMSNACGNSSTQVNVDVVKPVVATAEVTGISCPGNADASIEIFTSGGQGSKTYTWAPSISNTFIASELAPGNYEVIVSDQSNCEDTVRVSLSDPPPLSISVDIIEAVSCPEKSDGSIQVSASGGVPPYRYSIDGTLYVSLNTFSDLAPGDYTLYAQDANGCVAQSDMTSILTPSPLLLALTDRIDTDCNNTFGSITVSATGGTLPYQFAINNMPLGASNQFNTLGPGSYTLRVEDEEGCETKITTEIIRITDPKLILDTVVGVTCFGLEDGSIAVEAQGGTLPYSYSLDGGAFEASNSFTAQSSGQHIVTLMDSIGCTFELGVEVPSPDSLNMQVGTADMPKCFGGEDGIITLLVRGGTAPYEFGLNNGSGFSSSPTFEGLSAGNYLAQVRDAQGCTQEVSLELAEPEPVALTVNSLSDPLCVGDINGRINVNASGGVAPYRFSINGTNFFADGSFLDLSAGAYLAIAQDQNGCLDTRLLTLNDPPPLSLSVLDQADVACFGGESGRVTVIAQGGTAAYEYARQGTAFSTNNVFSELLEGNYTFITRDAAGCLAEISTRLSAPLPLALSGEWENVTCAGDSNGFAAVFVSGGTAPYSYAWSNGATQSFVDQLSGGLVDVLVQDANNCLISESFEIQEPPRILIDTLIFDTLLCFGDRNASAEVRASGGTPPLQYLWSNGATDSLITNLGAGQYLITVSDTVGCEEQDSLSIIQPEALSLTLVDEGDGFCDQENGFLVVEVQGGTPEYALTWDTTPIQEGPMLSDLGAGTYTLSVRDSNACALDSSFTLNASAAPIAAFETEFTPLDTLVFDGNPIQFENLTEAAARFSWVFGDGNSSTEASPSHRYEDPGIYPISLIAFDSLAACPDTAQLVLVLQAQGKLFLPNAFSPNGDGINDLFQPIGEEIIFLDLRIFDRWGREIVVLNQLGDAWDGTTSEGQSAQEGVYVYTLKAMSNNGLEYSRNGTVMLLR